MAKALTNDQKLQRLQTDFVCRTQAVRFSNHLQRIFVDPVDMQNPIGEEFSIDVIEDRRCYIIGHWQIFFSVLLNDDRGQPPQLWLALNFFHHFRRERDAVTVVSFDQFTTTSCRSILGLDLRPSPTEPTQKTIEITNAPVSDYADAAREQIMTMLESPVPALTRLGRVLRIMTFKTNEVLNEPKNPVA